MLHAALCQFNAGLTMQVCGSVSADVTIHEHTLLPLQVSLIATTQFKLEFIVLFYINF